MVKNQKRDFAAVRLYDVCLIFLHFASGIRRPNDSGRQSNLSDFNQGRM